VAQVIIPWRHSDERAPLLGWVAAQYRALGWPVTVAEHNDGEWCKAQAILDGIRQAGNGLLVVADADVWADNILAAVGTEAPWVIPYDRLWRLDPPSTLRLMRGEWADLTTTRDPYLGVPGGGIVIVDRQSALEAHPDPLFKGWGGEDTAWAHTLDTLIGPHVRVPGRLLHLWHRPEKLTRLHRGNAARTRAYRDAAGDKAAIRVLLRGGSPRVVRRYRNTRTGGIRGVWSGSAAEKALQSLAHWERV
jgi:hypothetical protein